MRLSPERVSETRSPNTDVCHCGICHIVGVVLKEH